MSASAICYFAPRKSRTGSRISRTTSGLGRVLRATKVRRHPIMNNTARLPISINVDDDRVLDLIQLAEIPEEQIWLAKQKSSRLPRVLTNSGQFYCAILSPAYCYGNARITRSVELMRARWRKRTTTGGRETGRVISERKNGQGYGPAASNRLPGVRPLERSATNSSAR